MDVADAIDRSRLLLEQGRSDEALQVLLETASGHPDDQDLRIEIALLYTERGLGRPPEEDDAALADFAEALRLSELPLALAGTAKVLTRRGDYEGAEGLLKRALEADPDLPEAHAQSGLNRIARGDPAGGVESLARALELAPGYGPAYVWLASALAVLGRPDEAHRVLLEGNRRNPVDDGILVELGWSFSERTGEGARARESWRRAAELNRLNANAWRGLAWGAAEAEDELEMTRALDRAMELDPEGTRAFLDRSVCRKPLLEKYES